MAFVAADSIVSAIDDFLADEKLGRITNGHDLEMLVRSLKFHVGFRMVNDAEELWAKLKQSTRWEYPSRAKSTKRSLELAKQFRDVVIRTYFPQERLTIDLESCSAIFDGHQYVGFKLEPLQLLKYMAEHKGEITKGFTIWQQVFKKRWNDKSFRHVRDQMCEPFRSFMKSKSGQGQWLELPPINAIKATRNQNSDKLSGTVRNESIVK